MMKRNPITNFLMAIMMVLISIGYSAMARENTGITGGTNKNGVSTAAANCNATTAKAELDINNIRTTILVGGDLWWDNSDPKYEIPIGSGKHSIFAGSLWIGGIDAGGQIKVAAQTYRQTGIDFWGGPIDTTTVNITQDRCQAFDRHWKVTREEVRNFYLDNSQVTNDIKSWPGNGDGGNNESQFLAPFMDVNNDNTYDYRDGDYPRYFFNDNPNEPQADGSYPLIPNLGAVKKALCNDYLFGDKTIWWVFNDVGNAHTETNSDPIGLEIRAQAFAFRTNDEINNMTFYKYQIINRSTLTLTETYFGQWVDPDLGNYTDDYVGCDVPRGLGFVYNGDADDETGAGYGLNPPALGVDFFQGPIADTDDGVDNDRDGCIDCTYLEDSLGVIQTIDDNILGEQIIMSKFVYYNNDQTPSGNPTGFADFYNYLRGIWRDNQPITYGADGRDPSAPVCDFMFPGDTDPINFPTLGEWSEATAGNPPADRRFLQSAGTFTLQPGAVNYVTTGVVWARAQQGGPLESVKLMKLADDKAQALFDNCFKLIDGPTAPDLAIRELDKRFIFSIQNYNNSNTELYDEEDPTIVGVDDSLKRFKFQGYQVFQFRDASVTTADIGNPDKVRLAFQCDIKDNVAQIVNYTFDPNLSANVPMEMVNGNNKGISHTFEITTDLFATGSTRLINHKTYYYTVVAYAHNEYKKYDQNDPNALDGQKKPYLAGRGNIKTYTAIPHNPTPENAGQVFSSDFGSSPNVTRIEGQGNGGNILDFADDYESQILVPPYRVFNPQYVKGKGPLNLKVYDPTLIRNFNYVTKFDGFVDTSEWVMVNVDQLDTIPSERVISIKNEQVIPEWGFSATINQVIEAGKPGAENNAYLTSSIEFSDPSKAWLTGVTDVDDLPNLPPNPQDWIKSNSTWSILDPDQVYETILGGTWAPFKLTASTYPGPKGSGTSIVAEPQVSLSPSSSSKTSIGSVDIIITPNKDKWTRAAVVETGGGTSGIGTIGSMGNNIVVNNGGSGYTTPPTVIITGTGTGASAVANLATSGSVKTIEITNGGTGYPASTVLPIVFSSGNANAEANTDANGTIVSINLISGGTGYTTAPTVTVTSPTGSGFSANVILGYAVASISVTSVGYGYNGAPSVTIDGDGTGATVTASFAGAKAFDLRRSASVDKNGNPDPTAHSPFGMGWFPGYAVNVETGERLNIAFGENSVFGDQNSRDMKWNPTSTLYEPGISPPDPRFGGMHYIYIFGHNGDHVTNVTVSGTPTPFLFDVPMYDEAKALVDLLRLASGDYPGASSNSTSKRAAWKDAMWVSLPLVESDFANLNLPDQIPTDVKIRIRVARSYRGYATVPVQANNTQLVDGTKYYVASTPVIYNGDTLELGESFTAVAPALTFSGFGGLVPNTGTVTTTPPTNGFNPMYKFGTGDLANSINNTNAAKGALDLINVVPNPYYAFSTYEDNQLDNRIKITNLPPKCTVSIFTMSGTLVRQFKRDVQKDNSEGVVYDPSQPNTDTSLDWDLKNQKGIPVASGLYLIHVEAPGLGERTLKWLGMVRPIDLDTF